MDKNKIKYEYDGVKYTLQYTRASVEFIEDELGFDINSAKGKVVSSALKLFRGAFIANHPRVNQDLIDEMYDLFEDKQGLFKNLLDMYVETYNALFEEPKDDGKNIKWERAK